MSDYVQRRVLTWKAMAARVLGCYSGSRFADSGGAVVPGVLSEGGGRMDEGNLSGGEELCGGGGGGASSADKTIHSGHFMVSCLSDEELEEGDEGSAVAVAGAAALDTPSCPACPPTIKEEAPEELRELGPQSSYAYDFAGASRQTRDTYQFEAPCSNAIDQSLAQMLQHMKLAYRSDRPAAPEAI